MVLVADNEVRPEYAFEASNAVDTPDRFRTLVDRRPD